MKKILGIFIAICVVLSTMLAMTATAEDASSIMRINLFQKSARVDHGSAPGEVVYNDDGSITMKSDFFNMQHQVRYKIADKEALTNALNLANSDDGDGLLHMTVSNILCSQMYNDEEQPKKGIEIKLILSTTAAARAEGKQAEFVAQSWVAYGQQKDFKIGIDETYTGEDFSGAIVIAQNYSVNGGAGNLEIVFSDFYATTGETVTGHTVTIPTVDPNLKTSKFLTFSDKTREQAYGNPPDRVTYDDNGGVTIKSFNTKQQHQVDYYFRNEEETNTALAVANREGGTGTVECTVTVLAATDANGNEGKVEVQLTLFSKEDVNGYRPETQVVQAWQAVGTTKTYYMDISGYKSFEHCGNFKICVQNYWYYDEAGNLVEHPDWDSGKTYKSAEMAPTVYFSPVYVSEKRWDEANVIYGDANGDEKITMADVLLLRKYLAKWNVEINLEAADANADTKVTMADVLLLRKYLAKWNVVLGK